MSGYKLRPRKQQSDDPNYMELLKTIQEVMPSKYMEHKIRAMTKDDDSDGFETVSDDSTYVPSDDDMDSEDSDDYETESEWSDEETETSSSEESDGSEDTLDRAINLVFRPAQTKPKGPIAKNFFKLLKQKPMSTMDYFNKLMIEDQQRIMDHLKTALKSESTMPVPMEIRIIDSAIPEENKVWALNKLSAMRRAHDGELHKHMTCLDALLRIPFGKYTKIPVSISDGYETCSEFLREAQVMLDKNTYGLNDAKDQIMQFLGQLIANPQMSGQSIAIKGPMGTGKSSLIKDIGKILGRPVEVITLGGAKDCSDLDGHAFTYEGSRHGRILEALMRWQKMDIVFHFDELDKTHGPEIFNLLMHVTDKTLNDQFRDKYFANVNVDLSRALFVFTLNDESLVDRVLLDRMYKVETTGYSMAEKVVIAHKFTIPDACKNLHFEEGQVVITDAVVGYIIEHYTSQEKGVRNMKRCIETILSKLNMDRLLKRTIEFPVTVTPELVRTFLKDPEPRGYSSMYS